METLEEYKSRVYSFMKEEISDDIEFRTNSGLVRKTSYDGKFLSFVGDTVVFFLDDKTQSRLQKYQDILYEKCRDMLAEQIDSKTFHVTLHDLCNGNPSEELWKVSEQNYIQVTKILEGYQQNGTGIIQFKPVAVFNMMNTSVVLGLEPANDRSCQVLMELYEEFQQVVELNYPLTLHVTLAYFKPGEYDRQMVYKLKEAIHEMNIEEIPLIEVDMKKLLYQRFDDMNHYYTVTEQISDESGCED